MKDFYDFKQFLAKKGNMVDDAITAKVTAIMKKQRHFPNNDMKEEFYKNTVMKQTILELLEQYHNWMNAPEHKHK